MKNKFIRYEFKGNNYNDKPCFVRFNLILETTKNLYMLVIFTKMNINTKNY